MFWVAGERSLFAPWHRSLQSPADCPWRLERALLITLMLRFWFVFGGRRRKGGPVHQTRRVLSAPQWATLQALSRKPKTPRPNLLHLCLSGEPWNDGQIPWWTMDTGWTFSMGSDKAAGATERIWVCAWGMAKTPISQPGCGNNSSRRDGFCACRIHRGRTLSRVHDNPQWTHLSWVSLGSS